MSIADFVLSPYAIPVAIALFWIVPYLTSNTALRNVPGPFFAKFSNLWLMAQARQGKRYLSVDQAHKKYGKLVRIQPDHVSVADESAINAIYGHGNGFLKSWVSPDCLNLVGEIAN
jgi:benzoate 4-monooxygenase